MPEHGSAKVPLFKLGTMALALGILGAGALQVRWVVPLGAQIACDNVLANTPNYLPTPGKPMEYTLVLHFREPRPDVEVILQQFGRKGYGWFSWRVGRAAKPSERVPVPSVAVQHVRVGLETLAEYARGRAIREASRDFDIVGWVEHRGWVSPTVSICWETDLKRGNV